VDTPGGSGNRIPVGRHFTHPSPGRPLKYRFSFPGIKRPGRGVNHPPPSSAEVKERIELHHYSPSEHLWPVLRRTLPLPLLYLEVYILTKIFQLLIIIKFTFLFICEKFEYMSVFTVAILLLRTVNYE
jgi:hypothetical protein